MKKILLIDDDLDMVEAQRIILESNGYEVVTAFDADSGFEKVILHSPDLIILDIMMTALDDGFQLAYRLRKDKDLCDIPILIISSIRDKTDFEFDRKKDEAYMPVDKFLEKPVSPEKLLKEIDYLLYP